MHRLLLMSVVGATVLCTVGAQNDNSTGELALPNPKVFINLFICCPIFHSIYLFFLKQLVEIWLFITLVPKVLCFIIR